MEQLEQHTDRVVAKVEGMDKKFLPATSKCKYVDNATRKEIRVQLSKFPHMLIAMNTSYVDKQLILELRLGSLPQGGDANRGRDAAAAGGPSLTTTLAKMFRLASAPFSGSGFSLTLDGDSIFSSSSAEKPAEVRPARHAALRMVHDTNVHENAQIEQTIVGIPEVCE